MAAAAAAGAQPGGLGAPRGMMDVRVRGRVSEVEKEEERGEGAGAQATEE